jgi:non-specific serine/threonine protein kinase
MLEVLAALVDKSLVIADIDGYECRYRLLESFRQFAAERLTVLGQQELITHRFVRACLEVAKQVDRSYEFGPDGVWRAIADAELHNWRAALAWCLLDRHDVELGQRLAAQLHGALGRFALDGRHWLDVALELVDERTPRDLLARLYSARARVAEMYRDWQAALRYNEAAISLFESTSDPLEIAWAQFGAGWSLLGIGRNSEAGAQLQEALLVRKYGNSRVVGYTLRQLSVVSANEGDLARARSYVTEAMQVHCELGLDVEVAWCKWQLGEFEMFEGNIEAALQTDIEVLETFRHFDVQVWGTGWVLCHLVGRLVVLRRYDDSVRCTGEALALTSEQAPALVAPLLECLAWSVALREDEKTADDVHAKAARLMGFAQVEPRESLLKGWWQEPHDRAIDALCKSIGHDAVTRCMGEGAALSPDLAVELARSLCAQNCLA